MNAVELRIKRRRKLLNPEAVVRLSDFVYQEGPEVDFEGLWREHASRLTPYCIAPRRRWVVFVRVPDETDLQEVSPFFYHAQREHAECLYAISYDSFVRFARGIPDRTKDCLFLYSTGRCGSTLLMHLLAAASGAHSVSEPDIYTQVAYADAEAKHAELLAAYTRVLAHHVRLRHPERPRLILKLRSQCTYIADRIREAVPEASNLFLYRNAMDFTNSFCSAFFGSWGLKRVRRLPFAGMSSLIPPVRKALEAQAPLLSDEAALRRGFKNTVGFSVLMWLSAMRAAQRFQKDDPRFFDAVVRYEDLTAHPHAIVPQLLEACGLSPVENGEGEVEKVLARNSQAGSRIASKGVTTLDARERELVQRLVKQYTPIGSTEYTLPGTLRA